VENIGLPTLDLNPSQKPHQTSEFRDFLSTLSVEIEKTKLLDYCKTNKKESNYKTKKKLFHSL
jgi:hypothetical protein